MEGRESPSLSRYNFQKLATGNGASLAASKLSGSSFSDGLATGLADTIFRGGKIYTVEAKQPWAEAVAIQGNRIVYVGSQHGAEAWQGSRTKVVEIGHGLLLPGFVDGHNHFLAGAVPKRGVALTGSKDKTELLNRIRQYVQAEPHRPYYLGYDWSYWMFGGEKATRQDLDSIVKDTPILLFNDDTHDVWFNTAAMQAAKISQDTTDPKTGHFQREADGTPSGIAAEGETWMPMAIATGAFGGKEMLQEAAGPVFELACKSGITACHDMGVFAPDLPHGYLGYELLQDWEKTEKLTCRIKGVYGTRDAQDDIEQAIATLKDWNLKYQTNLLQITGLKIWADGTPLSHTAVQLDPYTDDPSTSGESDWTADILAKWIEAAYRANFDVHIHVTGDGSLRRSLDAFEAVGKKMDTRSRRSVLHHINAIHPIDLPRFKRLGISGNATLEWLVTSWEDYVKLYSKKKIKQEADVWKKLISAGVNVSFGSDIPGCNPNELPPLYQMQTVLTRHVAHIYSKEKPPVDRIPSLEQMIYGYTFAGAYQMRMEAQIGSIKPGKLADLVLLEQNPFSTSADALQEIKIRMTMLDGRVIYQDGSVFSG